MNCHARFYFITISTISQHLQGHLLLQNERLCDNFNALKVETLAQNLDGEFDKKATKFNDINILLKINWQTWHCMLILSTLTFSLLKLF